MHHIPERVPLARLQILQSYKSPMKRIKIPNQKFPSDFFIGKNGQKKYLGATPILRKEPRTQQEYRANVKRLGLSIPRRQMSTALQKKDNDQQLIMGVISTAREMRRVIRKHSVEVKNQKSNKHEQMNIELPPIIARKGVTTCL